MFSYSKDLNFDVVLPQVKAAHKRKIYKMGVEALAKHIGVSSSLLLARLQEPNRLSRACAGDGVVVADMKLSGLKAPCMVLITLDDDVDFGAVDGIGANVFCIVLSPERERMFHLRLVSRVMRLLKNPDVRAQLSQSRSEHDMRTVLGESERFMVAA